MLVLTRKPSESLVIDGNIKVTILAIQGSCIKLGIDAPSSVPVYRTEVQQRIANETRAVRQVSKAEARAAALHAVTDFEKRQAIAGLGS